MTESTNRPALVRQFLDAIQHRQLARCHELLASLTVLGETDESVEPWRLYLSGILIFEEQNDWAAAEAIFTQLCQQPLDAQLQERVWHALGRTHEAQAQWQDAIGTYENVAQLAAVNGRMIDCVKAWKHIAICYRKGYTYGDFPVNALDQAIAYNQKALETLARLSVDSRWLEGSIWNALGILYYTLANWSEALRCYEKVSQISHQEQDFHGEGIAQLNLGEIYEQLGPSHFDTARQAYLQALSVFQRFDNRELMADALANLAYLHHRSQQQEEAGSFYAQALQTLESIRAGISSEPGRAGFGSTLTDIFANAILHATERGNSEQAFNFTERARARTFLDTLAGHSQNLPRDFAVPPLALQQVQAALADDELLLAYYTTGLAEPNVLGDSPLEELRRHRSPRPTILLFIVTRHTYQLHDTNLAPNWLQPTDIRTTIERHFLKKTMCTQLYRYLVAPAASQIVGKRRLYITPHGPLHYIPFQALLTADDVPLLDENGPQIIYGASATILFSSQVSNPQFHATLPQSREQGTSVPNPQHLAYGYNGGAEIELQLAEAEANLVAQLTSGHAYIGAQTKRHLYQRAATAKLLHFSCHGEFVQDVPLNSFLSLAPKERLTAQDVIDHLQLAGPLIILSACESGLSKVRRGDELMGLIRAFFIAGASTLIASLWRVNDCSTLLLMEKFYQEFQAGTSPATALQRAQIDLRNLTRSAALARLENLRLRQNLPELDQWLYKVRNPYQPTDNQPYQERPMQHETAPTPLGISHINQGGHPDDRPFAHPYYWAPFVFFTTGRGRQDAVAAGFPKNHVGLDYGADRNL